MFIKIFINSAQRVSKAWSYQNCKTGHINFYYVFEFEMIVVASLQQRVVLYVNRVTAEINPGTEGQISFDWQQIYQLLVSLCHNYFSTHHLVW